MLKNQKREQCVSQYASKLDFQMDILQNQGKSSKSLDEEPDVRSPPKSETKQKEKSQPVTNPYFRQLHEKPKKDHQPKILQTNSSISTISIRIHNTETSMNTTEQSDLSESFGSDDSYYEETEVFNVACLNA